MKNCFKGLKNVISSFRPCAKNSFRNLFGVIGDHLKTRTSFPKRAQGRFYRISIVVIVASKECHLIFSAKSQAKSFQIFTFMVFKKCSIVTQSLERDGFGT
jgi:hypothetical protein